MSELVNLGYNNTVLQKRVVAIVGYGSTATKRLKEQARKENRLIDATCGRKTRTVIITDSNHVILSSVHPETLSQRFNK